MPSFNLGKFGIYNDNTRRIITDRYTKAHSESDEFNRFICLRIAFNALYAGYYSANHNDSYGWDKSMWEYMCTNLPQEVDVNILTWNIKAFIDHIRNRTRTDKWTWWVINLKNRDIIIWENIASLRDLVWCIYAIRNNLFHWWKSDSEANKSLVWHASNALQELLKTIAE